MYVYNFYVKGNERGQSAWSKWIFENAKILNADFNKHLLYLTIQYEDGVYLEVIDFTPKLKDFDLEFILYLDRKSVIYNTYLDGITNETYFQLPYKVTDTEHFKVIDDKGFELPYRIDDDICYIKGIHCPIAIGFVYKSLWQLPLEYLLGDKLTKGFTKVENGKVIIYTNGLELTSDEIRQNLAHEMEHARQFQKAINGDEEAAKQIKELYAIEDLEQRNKHPLEIEAENNKTKLESELSGNDTNGQGNRAVQSGNDEKLGNEGFNKSLDENGRVIERGSREEGLGGDNAQIQRDAEQNRGEVQGSFTADTRPIEERTKSIKSEEEANAILDEAVQTEKEVIPWKVTLENAEDFYQQFKAKGLDTKAIREAISNNDVELANMIAAKQLASERLIKDIANELLNTTDKARYAELYEAMTHLANISKKLSSASGRTLNAQKVVNKARQFFSLTTLEEEGLQSLADLLSVDIKSLNFTRNISDLKKELYQKISKYNDGIFFDELTNDTSTLEA